MRGSCYNPRNKTTWEEVKRVSCLAGSTEGPARICLSMELTIADQSAAAWPMLEVATATGVNSRPPCSTRTCGYKVRTKRGELYMAKSNLNELRYEQRFVAFVDILGFKELVERTRHDPDLFRSLHEALTTVEKAQPICNDPVADAEIRASIESQNLGNRGETLYRQIRSSWGVAFSDCLVRSELKTWNGLVGLCFQLWRLARKLLRMRVLVRGGISTGEIFHSDRIVFGPALIESYILESQAAVYPRILLSDEVVQAAREFDKADHGWECGMFLREDFDGLYHLDYLSEGSILRTISKSPYDRLPLDEARTLVTDELKRGSTKKLQIRAKWQWTLRYIEAAIHDSKRPSAADSAKEDTTMPAKRYWYVMEPPPSNALADAGANTANSAPTEGDTQKDSGLADDSAGV